MRLPQDRILHIDTELAGDEVRVVMEWQGEIVRCKDCEYKDKPTCPEVDNIWFTDNDFCSWAKMKGEK